MGGQKGGTPRMVAGRKMMEEVEDGGRGPGVGKGGGQKGVGVPKGWWRKGERGRKVEEVRSREERKIGRQAVRRRGRGERGDRKVQKGGRGKGAEKCGERG